MVSFQVRKSPVKPSMQQVIDWLEKLGISEYAQHFANNEIDLSIVDYVTDQDLKDSGIALLGSRRKILRAIAELDRPKTNGRAPNRRVGSRAAIDKPLSGSNLDTSTVELHLRTRQRQWMNRRTPDAKCRGAPQASI
jgi:SAM domain (Sterile alpha motif)